MKFGAIETYIPLHHTSRDYEYRRMAIADARQLLDWSENAAIGSCSCFTRQGLALVGMRPCDWELWRLNSTQSACSLKITAGDSADKRSMNML